MKVYGQLVFKPLALMKVLRSTHFTNFIINFKYRQLLGGYLCRVSV